MTTLKNLDNSAKFFLQAFQQQNGVVGNNLHQKIADACEAKGSPLNAQELEKAMLEAMPASKAQIGDMKQTSAKSGYHADGCNANFLTQQLSMRIEKERINAVRPNRRAGGQRWGRDPLFTRFALDPKANSLLLFNATDVNENGKPLLMKAVLRVTDPANEELCAKEKATFLEKMDNFADARTKWKEPDIQFIGRDDIHVETKDVQEDEFNFGASMIHVSLDHTGKELSRGAFTDPDNKRIDKFYSAHRDGSPNMNAYMGSNRDVVNVGHELDTEPAKVFEDRIQLSMQLAKGKELGADWLDSSSAVMDIKLLTEPGLLFEPGKTAHVNFYDTNLEVQVDKDDAFMTGTPANEIKLDLPSAHSLRYALTRTQLARSTSDLNPERGPSDAETVKKPAVDFIYARPDKFEIGGSQLKPLADQTVLRNELRKRGIEASMVPTKGDAEQNGTTISIKLNPGFLKANNGGSVEGWSVAAGFNDPEHGWQQCKAEVCGSSEQSGVMKFTLKAEDLGEVMKHNRNIELRVFNHNGVPAQRLNIPSMAIPWSDKALP